MPYEPSKTEAKKDQYVGNAKETAGNAVGSQSLQNEGRAQHSDGLIQETTSNLTGLVNNTVGTATGAVSGVLNGLLGSNNNPR